MIEQDAISRLFDVRRSGDVKHVEHEHGWSFQAIAVLLYTRPNQLTLDCQRPSERFHSSPQVQLPSHSPLTIGRVFGQLPIATANAE